MQCSMQHIPFHSALLAKNTIFDPKKHFFPQSTPEKVRKSQQILKMWRNSICLGWKFLSESKLFGEGHWRFLAIWNLCHPAMRIFLPQYVTSRFYIVKGVPPPVFPWKIVWAKKPPHKRKTPKLFSKNWPKRAEIKVFGVKILFLASSYQSFLVTPPGPLTLLAPVTYLRISVQIRVRARWKNFTFLSYEFGKGQHTF